MTNLWLIPASNQLATKNIARSMENEIDIEIRHTLGNIGIHEQYAWGAQRGTNDSNVSIYEAMSPGDICLFYTADQREADEPVKAFRWAACITEKLQDSQIADQIWPPEQPGETFELIYFLTAPVKIFIPTSTLAGLLTEQGEKYASPPKGFMRLKQENLDYLSQRYGSLQAFFRYVLAHHAEEDVPVQDYPSSLTAVASHDPVPSFVNDLLSVKKPVKKGKSSVVAQRRSKHSKEIGDAAERYIEGLLRSGLVPGVVATNVKHVADQKVGWDIQYVDEQGNLVRVEVKGSTAMKFSNFEVTVNELNSLMTYTDSYHFYLVGGCMSEIRKVQIITDMAARLENSRAVAAPITFRVELMEPSLNLK